MDPTHEPGRTQSYPKLVEAIKAGDTATLQRLVFADPELVARRPDDPRSVLHHATDWPGHFPHVAETIELLIAGGADPNWSYSGTEHSETPLHWAASSNDVAALDALLDGGAEIDATGAVIDRGTPLVDAVVFQKYEAAARLLERGAAFGLHHCAALGRQDLVETFFDSSGSLRRNMGHMPQHAELPPTQTILDRAFQFACRAGHLELAKFLLARGSDPNAMTPVATTPLDEARKNEHSAVVAWLESFR